MSVHPRSKRVNTDEIPNDAGNGSQSTDGPGTPTPFQTGPVRAVLASGGGAPPLARLTGETVKGESRLYSHLHGRWISEEVEMELLVTTGPMKFGRHAREVRDVGRLFVRTSVEHDGPIQELYVGVGAHVFACGWVATVETCPGCGVAVIWNLQSGYGSKVRRRTDGPYSCSERCRSRLRRPEVDLSRECVQCGERFAPSRRDARTCSTRCRVALHRAGNGSQPIPGRGSGSVTEGDR